MKNQTNQPNDMDRRDLIKLMALMGLGGGAAGLGVLSTASIAGDVIPAEARQGLRRGYVDTSVGQVHYWTKGKGPYLLAIHQSSQCADEYLQFAEFLKDSYTVIGVDLPGHGNSENPPHELTVAEFSDAAIAVLDQLKVKKTHLVGHHGGAGIARDIAVRQAGRIDKVALSGAGISTPVEKEDMENTPLTRDLPIESDGDFLMKTWNVYRKMSAKKTPPEITYLPFLVSLQSRMRPFDMHFALYNWDRQETDRLYAKETLLISPKEDYFGGDSYARLKQWKNSSVVEIEDGGAWVFYEQPEACAQAIAAFLN